MESFLNDLGDIKLEPAMLFLCSVSTYKLSAENPECLALAKVFHLPGLDTAEKIKRFLVWFSHVSSHYKECVDRINTAEGTFNAASASADATLLKILVGTARRAVGDNVDVAREIISDPGSEESVAQMDRAITSCVSRPLKPQLVAHPPKPQHVATPRSPSQSQ